MRRHPVDGRAVALHDLVAKLLAVAELRAVQAAEVQPGALMPVLSLVVSSFGGKWGKGGSRVLHGESGAGELSLLLPH